MKPSDFKPGDRVRVARGNYRCKGRTGTVMAPNGPVHWRDVVISLDWPAGITPPSSLPNTVTIRATALEKING